jgi:hypothetical protein
MSTEGKILDLGQLKAGDVLLCYGEGKIGDKIAKHTGSDYSHAVICYSATEAVESGGGLVQKVAISDIVADYSHVAVFRSPVAWSPQHVTAMNIFLDNVIAAKCKYNIVGVFTFVRRKENHELTLPQQIEAYFAGELKPDSFSKDAYFCSELVADCFAATGFLHPSASVVFKSDTYAPGDLGKDPTFGTFVGYLTLGDASQIPEDDEFIDNPTFGEAFGEQ